jgi:peptidoglycan/LPS O-acetylase OafA/YrhL
MKQNSARIGFRALALSLGGIIAMNQLLARTSLPLAASHAALCPAAGILIGRAAAPASAKLRKASGTIAKYSYGIYLSHLPLMWLCFRHGRGRAETALFVVAAVAVPIAAYHWIEAPMIRLGVELTEAGKSRVMALREPQSAGACHTI